jgi:hypothetical protein
LGIANYINRKRFIPLLKVVDKKEVGVIVISLLVLVAGIWMLSLYGGETVGQAIQGAADGSGTGTVAQKFGTGEWKCMDSKANVVHYKKWAGGKSTNLYNGKEYVTCCENSNVCIDKINDQGGKPVAGAITTGYCWGLGSIAFNDEFLCKSLFKGKKNTWVQCEFSTKAELTDDKQFICNADKKIWEQCNKDGDMTHNGICNVGTKKWEICGKDAKEGSVSSNGKAICKDKKWLDCSGTVKVLGTYACVNNEWKTCKNQPDGAFGEGYCSANKLFKCDDKNLPDELHCAKDKDNIPTWSICSKEGDKADSDQFVCNNQKWLDCKAAKNKDNLYCDVLGEVHLCGDNEEISNNNQLCLNQKWLTCSDDDKHTLEKEDLYACNKDNTWKKCSDEGSDSDKALYCDFVNAKKWQICDEKSKFSIIGSGTYMCDGETWKTAADTIEGFTDDNSKWVVDYKGTKKALDDHNIAQVQSINDALDADTKTFYSILKPAPDSKSAVNKLFFTYGNINYKAQYSTGKVEVLALGDTKVLGTATLTTEKSGLYAQQQVALNLNSDDIPDAYLHVLGGSKYADQSVLIVVTPKMDFDKTDSFTTLLTSTAAQKFQYQKEHSLQLIWELGDNYFMFFDNTKEGQFIITPEDPKGVPTYKKEKYYLNPQIQDPILDFTVLQVFDGFSIVNLTKGGEQVSIKAGTVNDVDLAKDYEATFDRNIVIKIKDKNKDGKEVDVISVCEAEAAAANVLTVCNKIKQIYTLKNKEPAPETNNANVVFLFTEGDKREGKAYYVIDTTNDIDQLATIFANNLKDGKKVTILAHGDYYLLEHEKTGSMDMRKLQLTRLGVNKGEIFLAEGDQEEVTFNLPLGKQINIKQKFIPDANEFSYTLSSKTVATPTIDLEKTFMAQVSTYGKVNVQPNLKEVKLNDAADVKLDVGSMKVLVDTKEIALDLDEPYVENGALLHYAKSANAGANTYTKYANVYLYKNLSKDTWTNSYNDVDFILPLVKGNKVAFSLEGKFRVLTYSEPWDGKSQPGFLLQKMQITDLDGGNAVVAVKNGNKYTFDFGTTRIEAEKITSSGADKLKFVGVGSKAVTSGKISASAEKITFNSNKDFAATLTPGTADKIQEITITTLTGSPTYRICDTGDIASLKSYVFLCLGDSTAGDKIDVDKEDLIKIDDNNQLWRKYAGLVNGVKQIAYKHIFVIGDKATTFEWTPATDNLAKKQYPYFEWANKRLELRGTKTLGSFELVDEDGDSYAIETHSEKDGANNGTIAVNEKLLFFQQRLDKNTIYLDVTPKPEVLVTVKGFNSTGQKFITSLGKEQYTLESATLFGSSLTKITIMNSAGKTVYIGGMPKEKTVPILLSNGDVIKVSIFKDGVVKIGK